MTTTCGALLLVLASAAPPSAPSVPSSTAEPSVPSSTAEPSVPSSTAEPSVLSSTAPLDSGFRLRLHGFVQVDGVLFHGSSLDEVDAAAACP